MALCCHTNHAKAMPQQHKTTKITPTSSSLMTADPSAAWALCCSAGVPGLVVTYGCSLAPKINEMSSCCKVLLVLTMSNLLLLLGGAELACTSLEARSQEQAGVWDAVVGMYLPVWKCAGRQ